VTIGMSDNEMLATTVKIVRASANRMVALLVSIK
jgi:hypothetical protein